MNVKEKNITSIVIATIISLITIVTTFGGFISNQTKLEVKLNNIEASLTEIKIKLNDRDNEIKQLTERIIKLEEKISR
jgi:peptidoglycan hydrolase CwlO-like protein